MADIFQRTYGLDIEIDTSFGAVDPAIAPIRCIAVSADTGDATFEGDEATILAALDHHLASLSPGVLATWNGSMFDLPFIAERSRRLGVEVDLQLVVDPHGAEGRQALPGHRDCHRGRWGAHRHLDTFRLYGDGAPSGPFALLLGLARRRGTVAKTGDLLNEALHANAASDARLARVLAERRGQAAARFVDRLPVDADLTSGVSRPQRTGDVELRPAIAGL